MKVGERFGNPELPFIVQQLAGYGDQYALVRDSQKTVAQKLNNVELNVLIDLGEKENVHPQAKEQAGIRAAGIALNKWYNIANTNGTFADLEKTEITDYNGNAAMKVYFKNVTGGFYTVDKEGNRTQTLEPSGFLIADNTGEFKIANAVINDDNTITVWNEEVQTPAYVRYAFEGFPYPEFANIYTENGLPITPFRTDDINVEYSYDRAAMGGDVNLLLNGDFEIVDATGNTFTGYYTHRITNVNYGGVTAGTWENETEEFGKYYADMTLYNGTGNANTQVYTAITGTKENARIPIRAGKYIIKASVDATFTDPSTELCMQMGFYSNDEKGMGNYYTNEQEWKVTESTDGMVDVVGEMIIGEEYDGCYLYAFGPRLVTKSSEMQNVKIDNIVFRRVEE